MESYNNVIRLLVVFLYPVILTNAARSSLLASLSVSLPPSANAPVSLPPSANAPSWPDWGSEYQPDLLASNNPDLEPSWDDVQDPADVDLASNLSSFDRESEAQKICDMTDHPHLCISAVLPQLTNEVNIDTVFNAAVHAGSSFAKHCQAVVQAMANWPGNSPELTSVLNDCKDGYDTAVENFEEAIDAFSVHDVGTMQSMLSAVITFVGDCEDELLQVRVGTPLRGLAEQLTNMTSNCLAISSLMHTY